MSRLLLSLLCLGAADALHYLEGTGTTEEIFANGTYSYAPQQYILYGIDGDLAETTALRTATAALRRGRVAFGATARHLTRQGLG